MKNIFKTLVLGVAVAILMAPFALAKKTPDGETPAEETVCDPLRADGVTKGLYGLCVTYCEAQDHAPVLVPTTEEELEDSIQSVRILTNYNKKKQDGDPDMPCACPCWTAEELDSIDGFIEGFNSTQLICSASADPATGLVDFRRIQESDPDFPQSSGENGADASDFHRDNVTGERCIYKNKQAIPPIFGREFSSFLGTITHAQAAACLEQVIARCDLFGL